MTYSDRITGLFKPWIRKMCPGGQVYAEHKGELVYSRCFGYSDIEHNAKINERTIFHVASVSKQFTCICALILHERGLLDIDHDVREYIPDLIAFDEPVTIRDMMNNVSGIRDQWELSILSGIRMQENITQRDILSLISRQKKLNFSPRSSYLYSNSNFSLTSEIVKRISGMPFNDFAGENVFRPLGMTNTFIREKYDQIIPNRAMSYIDCLDGTFRWKPLNFSNEGATSLHTTAADLIKWLKTFRNPAICSRKTIELMLKVPQLTSSDSTTYACGIDTGSIKSGDCVYRTLAHEGADQGYRAIVLTIPDTELDIAICANVDNVYMAEAAFKMAEIILNPDNSKIKAAATPKASDQEVRDISCSAGMYFINEWCEIAKIEAENSEYHLIMDDKKAALRLNSGNCYDVGETGKTLLIEEKNAVLGAGGETNLTLTRLSVPQFSDDDLQDLPGIYFSDEVESYFEITCEAGTLMMRHKRFGKAPILTLRADIYVCPLEYPVRFSVSRSDGGKPDGLRIIGHRVKDILFKATEHKDRTQFG